MSPSDEIQIRRLQEQVLSKRKCPACGVHGLRPDWFGDDVASAWFHCPDCGWSELLEEPNDDPPQEAEHEEPVTPADDWDEPLF